MTSSEDIQQQRDLAKKKFQRWTIIVPMIVTTFLALIGFGLLTWFALAEDVGRPTESGFADLLVIFICLIPMALIGLALIGGMVYLGRKRQQHGSYVQKPVIKGLRKVDEVVQKTEGQLEKHQPKVVKPVIKVNAGLASIGAFVRSIRDSLKNKNGDG